MRSLILISFMLISSWSVFAETSGEAMDKHLRYRSTYLFVADVDASLAFYEALGMNVERVGDAFGRALIGDELVLEFGSEDLTRGYDPNFTSPGTGTSKGTVGFELSSPKSVDEMFMKLVSLGYSPYLEPIDAAWKARFAIVLDPDGNQVGLHSPRSLEGDRERERGGT